MRILALDSCSRAGGAAVVCDGRPMGSMTLDCGYTHSETLLVCADNLLSGLHMTLQDMDAIAVTVGPGSFTGIRIGLSTAKGLAMAAELPLLPVSSLLALSYNIPCFDGIVAPCMDARRAQVYNAVFSVEDGKLLRLSEDRAISIEELGAELKNLEKAIFLVGDGAELCYNTLRVSIPALCLLPEHLRGQHASGTALAAQAKIDAGEPGSGLELIPSYLRLSQAERTRIEKENMGK